MPSVAQTINLTTLNNFMKNYPSGDIVPELYLWNSLYDHLKANVKKNAFVGNNVEILMETSTPFSFTGWGERIDLPYGDALGYVKQYIPLKEVIATAEITKQMMDRATGGDASWGAVLPRVLQARTRDFNWGMELCAIGDGTGRLGRCNGTTDHATVATQVVITLDNTYSDFGWENTALFKKGMWVEIYNAAGAKGSDDAGVYAFKVAAVTFGDRANGAATTGTVTLTCASDATAAALSAYADNGAIIHLAGTRSNATAALEDVGSSARYASTMGTACYTLLPMGLVGLVQKSAATPSAALKCYTDDTIDTTLDTFQGLTRYSYSTLNAAIYDGTDIGGARGVPEDWTLSAITDAINKNYTSTGKWTNLLVCSSHMAIALANQNATEGSFTISVTSTGGFNQPVAGTRYAKAFFGPDGREIPIQISHTIPANCLYGLCTEDLQWYTKGNFTDLALTGESWMLSPNQRKAVFENPFGGYSQLGANRVDTQWLMQDLKNNV